jgi:hypothetical protein
MKQLLKWLAVAALSLLIGMAVVSEERQPPAQNAAAAAAPEPPETGPRRPHNPPTPGEVREMTIRRLGNFNYEQLRGIPADVRRLDGMSVRLRGYVIPTVQAVGASQFALVPNRTSCCYGQPPGIEHTVMVSCASGEKMDGDLATEVIVKGTLRVGEIRNDDVVVSLYRVADASVRSIAR